MTELEQVLQEMKALREEQSRISAAMQQQQQSPPVPIQDPAEVLARFRESAEQQQREREEAERANRTNWFDEEDEELDADAVKVARKAEAQIRADMEAENRALKERLAKIEAAQQETASTAQQAAAQAAQERDMRFKQQLSEAVPDFYTTLQADPDFNAFLNEPHPEAAGARWGDLLVGAAQAGSAQEAQRIVQQYKARAASTDPLRNLLNPASNAGTVVPFPGGRAAHVDVAQLGGNRLPESASSSGQQGSAVIYDDAYMAELNRWVSSGGHRSEAGQKQYKAIMADMLKAQGEGRIRVLA